MLARKWTELVSKISERYIKKGINQFRSTDDTVEGQSKAFRLWMLSSTAAILLMLLLSFTSSRGTEAANATGSQSERSLIEQVPDGFVLVPIEPQNFETIDALIENHAYVDLYHLNSEDALSAESIAVKRGKRLIARGLPMVRAPKNPTRFAVLVKEADTNILTSLGAPVLVVVRKGPPKGGYPEPKNKRIRQPSRQLKSDFIVEEIPETDLQTSNEEK